MSCVLNRYKLSWIYVILIWSYSNIDHAFMLLNYVSSNFVIIKQKNAAYFFTIVLATSWQMPPVFNALKPGTANMRQWTWYSLVKAMACRLFGAKPLPRTLRTNFNEHYIDTIMGAMTSQITSLTIVCSTVYSRRRSKKTSKLRVTGLCARNSPVTGEFPAQRTSNTETVSIWWRHHDLNQSTKTFIQNVIMIWSTKSFIQTERTWNSFVHASMWLSIYLIRASMC